MSDQNDLRGGTQGGEAARLLDPNAMGEGTPGVGNPSGGDRIEAPSRFSPRTGLAERQPDERLAGGVSPEQVRGYTAGVQYPANKEDVIRAARRNGAPDEVLASLGVLPKSSYGNFDEVLLDYPALPTRDEVGESNRG